mgnify:CR=1 FL=1
MTPPPEALRDVREAGAYRHGHRFLETPAIDRELRRLHGSARRPERLRAGVDPTAPGAPALERRDEASAARGSNVTQARDRERPPPRRRRRPPPPDGTRVLERREQATGSPPLASQRSGRTRQRFALTGSRAQWITLPATAGAPRSWVAPSWPESDQRQTPVPFTSSAWPRQRRDGEQERRTTAAEPISTRSPRPRPRASRRRAARPRARRDRRGLGSSSQLSSSRASVCGPGCRRPPRALRIDTARSLPSAPPRAPRARAPTRRAPASPGACGAETGQRRVEPRRQLVRRDAVEHHHRSALELAGIERAQRTLEPSIAGALARPGGDVEARVAGQRAADETDVPVETRRDHEDAEAPRRDLDRDLPRVDCLTARSGSVSTRASTASLRP